MPGATDTVMKPYSTLPCSSRMLITRFPLTCSGHGAIAAKRGGIPDDMNIDTGILLFDTGGGIVPAKGCNECINGIAADCAGMVLHLSVLV